MHSISTPDASPAKVAKLSLAALAIATVIPAAHATLLSSESFSDSAYTVGSVLQTTTNSQTSPTVAGYTGNWIDQTVDSFGDANPKIISGSLVYGDSSYAATAGNSVGVIAGGGQGGSGRVQRLFDSSLTVTSSTTGTIYMSFLFQTASTGSYQSLSLYDGWVGSGNADLRRNFDLGLISGSDSIVRFNAGATGVAKTAAATTGVTASNVNLYIVKFDLSATAASDTVTVWVNPTLGAGDPASGGIVLSGQNITFDRLALSDYSGGAASWDEIRFGTTFADVTTSAIPEPSTYALFAGAATLLGASARRPRRNPS